ncbi:MAG: DNA cytosine methyltransferase, partial [Candidatus Micrarchaeaceae archaeon]
FLLQGFPPNFRLPNIADSKLYHQAGNSVTVPVVERIATNMRAALLGEATPGRNTLATYIIR